MAKQRFGVNDAYRGTVGTVIGYEWRGRWCLRARPLHVRNPRTAKQQSNRQLFKQMVDLASHMKFADGGGLGESDCQRGRGGGAGGYWHSAHGHSAYGHTTHGHTPQSAASGCQLP